MRDEDKPFVCYRQGRWQMRIVPRNAEGWRTFGMWLGALALLAAGHVALVTRFEAHESTVAWLTTGFLVLTAIWAIAMIRWMLPRAEVVRLDDLAASRQPQDRKRGRD